MNFQNQTQKKHNWSMVVSRNALTLDDNLTCEPASCFLTG